MKRKSRLHDYKPTRNNSRRTDGQQAGDQANTSDDDERDDMKVDEPDQTDVDQVIVPAEEVAQILWSYAPPQQQQQQQQPTPALLTDQQSNLEMTQIQSQLQMTIQQLQSDLNRQKCELVLLRGLKGRDEATNWFSYLPYEVLVEVLRCADYVTQRKVQSVSKAWKYLLRSRELAEHAFLDVEMFCRCRGSLKEKLTRFVTGWNKAASTVVREVTLNGRHNAAHSAKVLFFAGRFFADFDIQMSLRRLILRGMWFSGSTVVSQWEQVFSETEVPVVLVASKCELLVPTVYGRCSVQDQVQARCNVAALRKRSNEVSWYRPLHADLDVYGMVQESELAEMWWPYPVAQTEWLLEYIKLLKTDEKWMDWLFSSCPALNLADARRLLFDSVDTTSALTTDYFGSSLYEAFCQMTVFVLGLGHAGDARFKPPPYPFHFDTPALYLNS